MGGTRHDANDKRRRSILKGHSVIQTLRRRNANQSAR